MDADQFIFVGFELTNETEDQFVGRDSRDRIYLEDTAYLETLEIDGRSFIGKRTKDAIALDRIEDIARNVVSLLNRVCTSWSKKPDEVLVIAVDDDGSGTIAVTPEQEGDETDNSDDFDYGELVD